MGDHLRMSGRRSVPPLRTRLRDMRIIPARLRLNTDIELRRRTMTTDGNSNERASEQAERGETRSEARRVRSSLRRSLPWSACMGRFGFRRSSTGERKIKPRVKFVAARIIADINVARIISRQGHGSEVIAEHRSDAEFAGAVAVTVYAGDVGEGDAIERVIRELGRQRAADAEVEGPECVRERIVHLEDVA